ncbi:IclR family transcriptional regulator [Rathayibacter soli]|uniref:IclR family transcriptional regulator n=1 Tax=Rathayibacter soli TaxID=3144168 RepID=UPI0027E48535|nr:IclR family transcriptional regulator [Glaciibacter superstes]
MTVETIALSTAQPSIAVSRTRRTRRVQSVEHAIDVLQALAGAPHGMGVSMVAQRVGLSKATVHQLLGTLESRQLVVRDPMLAQYRLSWGLYELGATVVRRVDLARVARRYLDWLAAKTGVSVLLGLLDRDSVLYLDRGEASSGFHLVANVGQRTALHSTASGKVLLAFTDDTGLLQRIMSRPLARLTEATIVDGDKLRWELAQVRLQEYATCWQECDIGLCSLAIPVRAPNGAVIASLALAGSVSRLNRQTIPARLALLRTAAHMIGTGLGHSRGTSNEP